MDWQCEGEVVANTMGSCDKSPGEERVGRCYSRECVSAAHLGEETRRRTLSPVSSPARSARAGEFTEMGSGSNGIEQFLFSKPSPVGRPLKCSRRSYGAIRTSELLFQKQAED